MNGESIEHPNSRLSHRTNKLHFPCQETETHAIAQFARGGIRNCLFDRLRSVSGARERAQHPAKKKKRFSQKLRRGKKLRRERTFDFSRSRSAPRPASSHFFKKPLKITAAMYLDDSEKQKIPAGETLKQDLIFIDFQHGSLFTVEN